MLREAPPSGSSEDSYGEMGGMSFGFGGGIGEGGNGLGAGGGIGEGGIGSGDGAGTGSGGIGCGGNGSTSGAALMESGSAPQWNGMKSVNTNWAATIVDKPQRAFRVLIGIEGAPLCRGEISRHP
jgi:hypothetical protein